jgi:hypothetical protein
MILLPRGTPLYENVAAAKVKLPEMLAKLREAAFTGYLKFAFPAADGVLFFEEGKLISALLQQGEKRLGGFEALAEVCSQMLADGGSLNVYRLTKDLVMGLHALLHGDVLYRAQEIKLIDIKGLLEKLKAQRLNGCLRIYTADRTAIIFYKGGAPLGFFHDGSHDIETSASESQKIAGLPGAKVDVLATKSADELMHFDLLEMVNVDKLWESSLNRHRAILESLRREGEEQGQKESEAALAALEEDLKEVAAAYLGKIGRALVDKEVVQQGGRAAFLDKGRVDALLAGVERGAKLLASVSKVHEMIAMMRSEIRSRTEFFV